ncbi:MAG: hypothetical protein QME68_05245 [Elusimicrobiota bacterium]|nr:hypothetical protein [Elusimicrobiota bacterium]
MSLKFNMDYLKEIYPRYHKSSCKEKKQILDEFCKNCHYHRKHAIRLLNDIPPEDRSHHHKRKRNYIYLHQTISTLEAIWEATSYIWSVRLKAALPLIKKIRIGSKLKRIYNLPKTPFQRLCECEKKYV